MSTKNCLENCPSSKELKSEQDVLDESKICSKLEKLNCNSKLHLTKIAHYNHVLYHEWILTEQPAPETPKSGETLKSILENPEKIEQMVKKYPTLYKYNSPEYLIVIDD